MRLFKVFIAIIFFSALCLVACKRDFLDPMGKQVEFTQKEIEIKWAEARSGRWLTYSHFKTLEQGRKERIDSLAYREALFSYSENAKAYYRGFFNEHFKDSIHQDVDVYLDSIYPIIYNEMDKRMADPQYMELLFTEYTDIRLPESYKLPNKIKLKSYDIDDPWVIRCELPPTYGRMDHLIRNEIITINQTTHPWTYSCAIEAKGRLDAWYTYFHQNNDGNNCSGLEMAIFSIEDLFYRCLLENSYKDNPDSGYPDPFPPGGGTPGGGTPSISKPSEQQIKNQIKDNPLALLGDVDCDVVIKWLETAKHQVAKAQIDKLNSIRMSTTQVPWAKSSVIARVQDINDAYSTVVNMDYFPVTVSQLPVVNGIRLSATEFKEYIRKNMNNFVDSDKGNFTPYNYFGINDTHLWNSSNPNSAVIGIDIPGLGGINDEITDDDGAVIVSKFSNTGWTFTTIYDPKYGQHPVSGNRDFGYMQNTNGSYTFFTRGVDRLTYPAVTALQNLFGTPFNEADALWISFQNKIANFVNQSGGQAAIAPREIQRPDWQKIKDVIDGKKPLSSLSTDCI